MTQRREAQVNTTFGRLLRKHRKLHGLSLPGLAKALPWLYHSQIDRLERGTAPASIGRAIVLSEFLGIPLDEILAANAPPVSPHGSAFTQRRVATERFLRLYDSHPDLCCEMLRLMEHTLAQRKL